MFDTATTALLRAVLDEVCESVSDQEIGARTHVASKILEAATRGEVSPERRSFPRAHDVALTAGGLA